MLTSISLITFISLVLSRFAATSETKNIFSTMSGGIEPINMQNKATTYFLSAFAATAGDADLSCQQSNLTLLSIETDTEQDQIQRFLESHRQVGCVWTSGTYIAYEDTWIWGNSAPILYENFEPRQREDRTKNCLRLLGYNYVNRYKWMKENCDKKFHFICEIVL